MNLEAFLRHLQYSPEKEQPPSFEVDWTDAPLPYKLYRGLPAIPLSLEVPLTMAGKAGQAGTEWHDLGHFLWYVYGLAQITQSVTVPEGWPMQSLRRFLPSGGGLYPSELYVYVRDEELDNGSGIYHYDAAHHRLVLLRPGRFDSYLARVLGGRCDVSDCFATVFVSTMFWKNYFKYSSFAYRLQGLDAGVAIGQLLEVAKRFGYEAGVHFQFLDRAVHHLLGLSEREESVYAVIPLSAEPGKAWYPNGKAPEKGEAAASGAAAADLIQELPKLEHRHYVRSRTIKEYPQLLAINEASWIEKADAFRSARGVKDGEQADRAGELELPIGEKLSYDLAEICRRRVSPELDFTWGKVTLSELAALLRETTTAFSYRNDLDRTPQKSGMHVSLYVCLHGVEGIADGAYRYDADLHALQPIRPGDHRLWLQQAMSMDNVNLFQVPLCFHVAGDRDFLLKELGYRGYRILQMEAGMLVQRLLLAAGAIGLGGHPLLGFDATSCDELYQLEARGLTCLIQVPVGPYRYRPRLEGRLLG